MAFYGRSLRFLALTLPPACQLLHGSLWPHTHVLVVIAPVALCGETNRLCMRFYKGDTFKPVQVVDITCIKWVVGRVKDCSLWALIERDETGRLLEPIAETAEDLEE
jgi:hypothetical protein